jgi:hypothetical protein
MQYHHDLQAHSCHSVFQAPWNRIIDSVESIAHSHHQLADRIEKDIEHPLRNFHIRKDFQNMNTMSNNLATMAKDLEEAQERSDKLSKKGGRANTQKVDAASSKLEAASGQWESQAPFIFESLQALDESRVNNLRDLLTQYQTHESDSAQRVQENAVETLALMLEIDTDKEIQSFVNRATQGRAKLPTRTSTRQSSVVGTTPSTPVPPSTAGSTNAPTPSVQAPPTPAAASSTVPDDDVSENNSVPQEPKPGKSTPWHVVRLANIFKAANFAVSAPCLVDEGDRACTPALVNYPLKRAALASAGWEPATAIMTAVSHPGAPRLTCRSITDCPL